MWNILMQLPLSVYFILLYILMLLSSVLSFCIEGFPSVFCIVWSTCNKFVHVFLPLCVLIYYSHCAYVHTLMLSFKYLSHLFFFFLFLLDWIISIDWSSDSQIILSPAEICYCATQVNFTFLFYFQLQTLYLFFNFSFFIVILHLVKHCSHSFPLGKKNALIIFNKHPWEMVGHIGKVLSQIK